jgi:hypothetical protein
VKYAYFFSLLLSVCVTRVFLVRMEYKTVAAGSLPVKRGDFAAKLCPGFRVVLEYYQWVSLYITI